MSEVGKRERQTQNEVIRFFREQLGYRYLGNWHERAGNRWYREQLHALWPERLARCQARIDVPVNEVRVRRMKTRWGSCNIQARRIWLNTALASRPLDCLDYILVHEMAHLLERRHNKRFQRLLDQAMPNWRLYRDQLNKGPLAHEF